MAERLKPCPSKPNCVCSRRDASSRQRVEPFAISGDPAEAFGRLKSLLENVPRIRIVMASDDYVHAVCRTRLGFPDDVECLLAPEEGVIHVRSASRLGYSDWGVNRRRVEDLRRRFQGT